jgi:hypothetical protein
VVAPKSQYYNVATSIKDALVTKSYNFKAGVKDLVVPESHYQFSGNINGGKLLENF